MRESTFNGIIQIGSFCMARNPRPTGRLEPGMNFQQVIEAVVADTPVFHLSGATYNGGTSQYVYPRGASFPGPINEGEGRIGGFTLTEPPLNWSTPASHLHEGMPFPPDA